MTGIRTAIVSTAAIAVAACLSSATMSGAADEPPATVPASELQVVEAPPTSTTEAGPRVILIINRNEREHGTIELEDENVIVLRTRPGELKSFPKARVLEIIRLVEPGSGRVGAVILNDGYVREGNILEDHFEYVLLEIEGIRTRLPRSAVHHVILEPTFEERYADLKASIAPSMHDESLSLCQWLVSQRRYELALEETKLLLADAEIPAARELFNLIQAQLALGQLPDHGEASEGEGDWSQGQGQAGPVTERDLLPTELLTWDDVNIIRVYEIDFERPPHVTVAPETIRALIESYGSNKLIPASQTGRTRLFRADPLDIVRLIFNLQAREFYGQIQVDNEPYSLNLFRQRVHNTWLLNNCATSRCHGGVHAGRLFLHRRRAKDARVRYTNLMILERLKLDPEWPLVNFDDPAMSLIIQYGLPRGEARLPHPDVRGWSPVFTKGNTRLKAHAISWIESMMIPRPDYPVEYEPPNIGGGLVPEDSGQQGDRTPR